MHRFACEWPIEAMIPSFSHLSSSSYNQCCHACCRCVWSSGIIVWAPSWSCTCERLHWWGLIGSYVRTSHCAYLHMVGILCILYTALHTYIQWGWDSACSHLCVSVTFPLQCVVIIVGVIVCEISTGIFIELKKNEASVSSSVVSW